MSLTKTVELATKPKRAAPKAKYIDPIVQSTFNQDGALQEIVRALSQRLRDSNTTVVFKALITLHTMMRSGSLEPVYSYLSTSSLTLTLSSHEAPNISAYGHYLTARIKSYSNLKRDVIRDKSDRRAKDRLRKLKVEQGLLRETREIQRMIAACVESKFYTDDVDDDVSMTALRLLTKDLLVLFTCVNEGMINILEHYFEMSHTDATTALKIYKTFCRDTEKVVGYLGIAKKLYNVLNVPIPNLRHAPVSLAGSLEEYLNDPNFEKNRQEYKENKRVADGGAPKPASTPSAPPPSTSTTTPTPSTSAPTSTNNGSTAGGGGENPKSFTDFFESIESAQTPMFPGSPSFQGSLNAQMTGFGGVGGNPFGTMVGPGGMSMIGPFGQQIQPQLTGFAPTAAPNPFLQPQMTGFNPTMMMNGGGGGGGFVQPQTTGFMQPQMTGANPFRMSMMPTGGGGGGGGPFGNGMGMIQSQPTGNPFAQQQQQQQQQQPFLQPQSTGFGQRPMSMMQPQMTGSPNPFLAAQQPSSPFPPPSRQSTLSPSYSTPSLPTIQQSTPFTSSQAPSPTSPFSSSASPPPNSASTNVTPAPLVAQKTGARNPFAPAPGTVIPQQQPEQPKGPTMNDMAYQGFLQRQQTGMNGLSNGGSSMSNGSQQQQQQQNQQQQPQAPKKPVDAFSQFLEAQKTGTQGPLTSQKTGGLFASVASDFTFDRSTKSTSPQPQNNVGSSSSAFSTTPFSSLSISSSPAPTSTASAFSTSTTPSYLSSQPTGSFASSSRKPFQPTSSFGSNLLSEFSSSSTTPSTSSNLPPPVPSFSSSSNSSTSPAPLQPQSTGFNPFAGSKLPPLNSSLSGASGAFGVGGGGGGSQTQQNGGVTTGSLI